jgi:hypothetical protein
MCNRVTNFHPRRSSFSPCATELWQFRSRKGLPTATFLFLAVLAGAPAQAEPISFNFSVTVTEGFVRPPVASPVQVGDTFTGSLRFEPGEDSDPDPNILRFGGGTGAVVLGLNSALANQQSLCGCYKRPNRSGVPARQGIFLLPLPPSLSLGL